MKKTLLLFVTLFFTVFSYAQLTPEITSWVTNTTGATGYAGILSNVQIVQYTDSNVYISCTCIPGYSIGPWSNPNVAENQNFVFKITRHPQQNTGTPTAIGLGHIGVWSNGVSVFNSEDATSYNNQKVWLQNAYHFEYPSFDDCLGHAQQQGEYHHHVNPKCLYNDADSTHHSPIIGYAFDGFPIYGAYAYTNTNGTGAIKRMNTSYRIRKMTTRDTLPNGTVASSAGPAISQSYPLGSYIQDYEFIQGLGDLDERNGRFCVTPEYPNGIYAYFVTIDASLNPVYPYTLGATYYGTVQAGNADGPGGPGTSGHNTISEPTTIYSEYTGVVAVTKEIKCTLSPNPVVDYAFIYFDPSSDNNITGALYNEKGELLKTINYLQPSISYTLDMTKYCAGIYFLHLETKNGKVVQKIVKVKN